MNDFLNKYNKLKEIVECFRDIFLATEDRQREDFIIGITTESRTDGLIVEMQYGQPIEVPYHLLSLPIEEARRYYGQNYEAVVRRFNIRTLTARIERDERYVNILKDQLKTIGQQIEELETQTGNRRKTLKSYVKEEDRISNSD